MSTNGETAEEYFARLQAEQNELSDAQGQAQATGHQLSQGPLADFQEAGPELLERLTDPDVDSTEYQELQSLLQPFLSQTQMLAAHGEDFYDDIAHELLNENLADRMLITRRFGRHLTGPFRTVALDVLGYNGGAVPDDWSPTTKEAVRTTLVDGRTDRQSMGDGTLFKGITEMHVHSEVSRRDAGESKSGDGLLSALNPFK